MLESPDEEVGVHGDRGRANSQARWTVRCLRRVLGETDEEIGEVHIIHQPGTQLRSQSQNALVVPSMLSRPRGRVRPNSSVHKRSCLRASSARTSIVFRSIESPSGH